MFSDSDLQCIYAVVNDTAQVFSGKGHGQCLSRNFQISWLKETGIVDITFSFYVPGYDWDSDKKSALFSLFLTATENNTS